MRTTPDISGTIEAVCVGAAKALDSGRRKMQTAIVKAPLQGRVSLGPLGLPGDEHVYEDHGGLFHPADPPFT